MRDDETGKRSLFGPAPSQPTSRDSNNPSGPVTIECSRCGAATRVGIGDALRRLVRFSLWVPGRTYSRRLSCPACLRRSWVRLRIL